MTTLEDEPAIAPPPVIGDISEVRFAVVLYGGVSLAVYMNGVVQELLRMVRATAPAGLEGDDRTHGLPEHELRASEKTYRKLGQLVESDTTTPAPDAPIVRRFVIDILSGSSAGGINGVYLAKALANRQSIDALERLWVDEGDVAVLVNDRRSLEGTRQRARVMPKPRSLLNGRRMYRKLLQAFEGMDGDDDGRRSTPGTLSPYADQLDLYVTTTDLQGLRIPIRIANGLVIESRHRNVFHFRYASGDVGGEHVNEFHAGNNPFLAFAARCTSAFPFAFEPMVLSTIDDDLADFPRFPKEHYGADAPEWQRFYRDYLELPRDLSVGEEDEVDRARPGDLTAGHPFKDRQFGDGGSLDNKPFTWATGELLRRRADNPVDRKLLFVEPDPSVAADKASLMDPLENVVAQGLLLPRDETVRADLEAVTVRNEIIRRMESVLLSIETRLDPPAVTDPDVFTSFTLETEAKRFGASYAAYHTLRVESVTDDLATLFASALGYPGAGGYIRAIRYLVEAWIRERYPDQVGPDGSVRAGTTLTSFLFTFDMQYRFRRLDLVKRKIDHVYPLTQSPDVTGPILTAAEIGFWPEPGSSAERAFQKELLRLKVVTNEIEHGWYRRVMSELAPRPGAEQPQPFPELVGTLGLDEATLQNVLRGRDDVERRRRAWALLEAKRPLFEQMIDWLESLFVNLRIGANEHWTSQLQPTLPAEMDAADAEAVEAARTLVRLTWDRFEGYDTVAFPMLFGADVGEADEVEVIRISPIDARRLRNVTEPGSLAKVAGATLGHFGGFLSDVWRKNDILWGRLDAAEILIRTLVPPNQRDRRDVIERLRKEAQAAIVREHLTREEKDLIVRRVMDEIAGLPGPKPKDERAVGALAQPRGADPNLRTLVETLVADDDRLLEAFARDYAVDLSLPAGPNVKTLGRALHVTGEVLRGTADQRGISVLQRPFFWVGKLGQVLTGMAEAAIPGSWIHLLVRHWLALLYLFGGVLFVAGLLLGQPALQRWALTLLLVAGAVHLVLWVFGAFVSDRRWWVSVVILLLALLLVGMAILAWQQLVDLGREHPWIPFFGQSVVEAPSASPLPPP